MNTKLKISAVALLAGIYSANALADVQNANATATIVVPLTITNIIPMDFGSIAVGTASDTISVNAAGNVTAAGTAVVTDAVGAPLKFDITGVNLLTFSLTYVDGVLDDGTGNTMAVTITGDDRPAALNGAAQTVTAVGDLAVGFPQPDGDYSTATGGTPIQITANYN